jgi:hypothetical protein
VDDGRTGRIDRPARSGHESSQQMIARMNSVLRHQIYSGYASLYLSALGSLFALFFTLADYTGTMNYTPKIAWCAIFFTVLFLHIFWLTIALSLVVETPSFKRPKAVLFRVILAVFIFGATIVSLYIYDAISG